MSKTSLSKASPEMQVIVSGLSRFRHLAVRANVVDLLATGPVSLSSHRVAMAEAVSSAAFRSVDALGKLPQIAPALADTAAGQVEPAATTDQGDSGAEAGYAIGTVGMRPDTLALVVSIRDPSCLGGRKP